MVGNRLLLVMATCSVKALGQCCCTLEACEGDEHGSSSISVRLRQRPPGQRPRMASNMRILTPAGSDNWTEQDPRITFPKKLLSYSLLQSLHLMPCLVARLTPRAGWKTLLQSRHCRIGCPPPATVAATGTGTAVGTSSRASTTGVLLSSMFRFFLCHFSLKCSLLYVLARSSVLGNRPGFFFSRQGACRQTRQPASCTAAALGCGVQYLPACHTSDKARPRSNAAHIAGLRNETA